jgi:hypothetical protein
MMMIVKLGFVSLYKKIKGHLIFVSDLSMFLLFWNLLWHQATVDFI